MPAFGKNNRFKKALYGDNPEVILSGLIAQAIELKPKAHNLSQEGPGRGDFSDYASAAEAENFSMCQIGG